MNQNDYKKKLRLLADNEFKNMAVDVKEYVKIGLNFIDSVDPELRDDLNYPFIATVIDDDLISDAEVLDILKTTLDQDHLFHNINSNDSDSVYT